MALRAGYYGVKRWLWDKLQSVPAKVDGLIENINITGVKNFLIPLTSTYDNNGVVISPVSNGIKINGTTTAEVNYDYIPAGSSLSNLRGKFKLSLGVDSISGMNLVFYKSTSGSWNLSGTTKEIEVNLTDAEHLSGKVRIYIANAKTYSNVVISPMITLLSDPDDKTYEPYAMTNQKLTGEVLTLHSDVGTLKTVETLDTTDSDKFTAGYTSNICVIRKQGNIVTFNFRTAARTAAAANDTIFTIKDAGFKPSEQLVFNITGEKVYGVATMYTNGSLAVSKISASEFTSDMLAINGVYTIAPPAAAALTSPAPDDDNRNIEPVIEETAVTKTTRTKKTVKEEG